MGAQPAFLPVDARDVLAKDHLVWEVIDQVGEFDMAPFLAAYRADATCSPGCVRYCSVRSLRQVAERPVPSTVISPWLLRASRASRMVGSLIPGRAVRMSAIRKVGPAWC